MNTTSTYTLHIIKTGPFGEWALGDQIAATETEAAAIAMAVTLSPQYNLGIAIRQPDGTILWGE